VGTGYQQYGSELEEQRRLLDAQQQATQVGCDGPD